MAISARPTWVGHLRLLVLLIAIPALSAAVVMWLRPDQPLRSAHAPASIIVPVPVEERTDRLEGTLEMRWTPGHQVRNPGLSGIVTEVHVTARQEVRSGTPLFSVGGAEILAITGPRPLYRQLQTGDLGDDVRMVTGLLRSLGLLEGRVRSIVDPSVERAFARFYQRLGFSGEEFDRGNTRLPDATGHELSGSGGTAAGTPSWPTVFSPAAVVWVGRSDFLVASSSLEVGAPLPPAGEPVLSGFPTLRGATVKPAADAPPSAELARRLAGSTHGEFQARLGNVGIPLAAGAARVPPSALAVLRRHVAPGAESVTVSINRRRPRRLLAVPATAVFTKGGGACVLRPDGNGKFTGIDVRVVDSSLGRSFVTPVDRLDRVLANPRQLGLGCG